MRDHARAMLWLATAVAVFAGISAGGGRVQAEDPNSALNPYHVVEHWATLPDKSGGRQSASTSIATAPVFGSSIAAAEKPAKARTSRQFKNSTQPAAW